MNLPHLQVSTSDVEKAEEILSPKPDVEKLNEQGLTEEIEKIAAEVNPQNSTLKAMKGK